MPDPARFGSVAATAERVTVPLPVNALNVSPVTGL